MNEIIKCVKSSEILIQYFEEAVIKFLDEDKELLKNDSIERTMVARIFLYLNQIIEENGSEIIKDNYFVDMEYARNKANRESKSLVKTIDNTGSYSQFDIVVHSRGNLKYDKKYNLNLDNLLHVEVKKDPWNQDDVYQRSDCDRLSKTTDLTEENHLIDKESGLPIIVSGYQYGIFLTGLDIFSSPEYRLFRGGRIIKVKEYNKITREFVIRN